MFTHPCLTFLLFSPSFYPPFLLLSLSPPSFFFLLLTPLFLLSLPRFIVSKLTPGKQVKMSELRSGFSRHITPPSSLLYFCKPATPQGSDPAIYPGIWIWIIYKRRREITNTDNSFRNTEPPAFTFSVLMGDQTWLFGYRHPFHSGVVGVSLFPPPPCFGTKPSHFGALGPCSLLQLSLSGSLLLFWTAPAPTAGSPGAPPQALA